MALLTPQVPTITGITPNYVLANATDTVAYTDANLFLVCKNTSAAINTVTVVVPGNQRGQAIPDVPITVPATTGEKWIGPLDTGMIDPVTNLITITNSAPAAGVTVALLTL